MLRFLALILFLAAPSLSFLHPTPSSPSFLPRPNPTPASASSTFLLAKSPKGSTSKKSIQIQLSQFIEGVGQKDEVVMVAPSYFSNVIVKKNLGRQISDKEVAELQRAAASSAAAQKEESERVAKLLSEIGSICITRKRASGDKLFGSVTTKNISDALRERVAEEVLTSKAAKLSVVGVKGDIKTAGSYECELSLPQGVTAKFELVVAGSDEECAT